MNKESINNYLESYIKPIYAFVMKKTKNLEDAEDLTQDIYMKIIQAVTKRDIDDYDKYIWSIVHNAVKNYYRKKAVTVVGLDQACIEVISDDKSLVQQIVDQETKHKLQREIAYLSNIQRKIVVMHYFSEIKQSDIASQLGIPLNTVKWHLREAKTNLKKGLKSMKTNHLNFNPIKFDNIWFAGAVGSDGSVRHSFKNRLSQNIAFSIYESGKTINEIADCLNVSPVFIEDELSSLENQELIIKAKDKYISNILIESNTEEKSDYLNYMYQTAAKLVANDLYDALVKSEVILGKTIYSPYDLNYLMWSIMPYVLSNSGNHSLDGEIAFDDVATLLPDGSHFIATAHIHNEQAPLPKFYDEIKENYGPLWNGKDHLVLWEMFNNYVDRNIAVDSYSEMIYYDLELLNKFINNESLTEESYALLIQKGYIHRKEGELTLSIVMLKNKSIKEVLFKIGDEIKKKHADELNKLKKHYSDIVLKDVPAHLKKKQAFVLQHIFGFDGWFNLYCTKELVNTGRLKAPTDEQRKSLIRLLINDL